VVICLEQGADLHMAQWIPLPLTVSCFSKIQICFTFLVPTHPGSPGQRAVKRVCVCGAIKRLAGLWPSDGTIWLQEKTADTIQYHIKYRGTIRYDMASKCCATERVQRHRVK